MNKLNYVKELISRGKWDPMIHVVSRRLSEFDEEKQNDLIIGFLKNPPKELQYYLHLQKGVRNSG